MTRRKHNGQETRCPPKTVLLLLRSKDFLLTTLATTQIQRQPPPPPISPRQHQIHLQRPLAPALPQANRQPQDEPPRSLRSDGPALPADQPRERRPESWRQSLGGDAESGAGRESSFPPSLPSICEISLAVLSLTFAIQYLYFPCGIIRGALAGLGMDVTVHADSSEIPAATFQIKTRGAKA